MDIYRDYFTREELVRVLAKVEYTPGRLGELGLFEPIGLGSTVMAIEESAKDGKKVLTVIPRGAPRTQTGLDKRKVHTFATQTVGDEGVVYADEVLNSRGRGTSGAKEIIEDRRQRLVKRLRGHVDYTYESMRMAALTAPNTTEFGSAPSTVAIAVQTDATKTRQEVFTKIIQPMETAMDGIAVPKILVLCSDGYWTDLIENKAIKDTYLNWENARELRNDPRLPFSFGGVNWERYRGTSAVKIPDNEAIAVPVGAEGFGHHGMAPNDTIESVGEGALGQPYYMGSKALVDSQGTKGWEISIQAHPKFVVARPGAVLRIAKTI